MLGHWKQVYILSPLVINIERLRIYLKYFTISKYQILGTNQKFQILPHLFISPPHKFSHNHNQITLIRMSKFVDFIQLITIAHTFAVRLLTVKLVQYLEIQIYAGSSLPRNIISTFRQSVV